MSSKVTFQRRCSFALLVPLVLLLQGCVRQKDFLDAEVRRLCAVDGGLRVYEKTFLGAEYFDHFGVMRIPIKERAKANDKYFYEWDLTYLRRGGAELWRSNFKVVRVDEQRVLGESIAYSRRGGDVYGPWSDSSFRCPEEADVSVLKQSVFFKITEIKNAK